MVETMPLAHLNSRRKMAQSRFNTIWQIMGNKTRKATQAPPPGASVVWAFTLLQRLRLVEVGARLYGGVMPQNIHLIELAARLDLMYIMFKDCLVKSVPINGMSRQHKRIHERVRS